VRDAPGTGFSLVNAQSIRGGGALAGVAALVHGIEQRGASVISQDIRGRRRSEK
jgi:hypothetical protein